ncbi:hypothetical protein BIW11_10336 [Tropilaelaps mercedesae]|uniref:Uncharacterized protein n=1 Tax=Tropilaelaps mercedesae TaxID=418985 RepID=A0A1V9XGG0_9ACAR|nr:hypothetical protein BIW11_10336 [Tropilaelaps mercedesae]
MQPIRLNLNINISTINDARGNLLQYFVRRGELADLLKRVCRLVNDRLIRSVSAFFQDTILGPMKDCYYVIQVSKIEDQALGSFDEPSDTYYDTDETTRLRIQKKLLDIDISMDDYDYEHDADAR